jgi:hypothetical protein
MLGVAPAHLIAFTCRMPPVVTARAPSCTLLTPAARRLFPEGRMAYTFEALRHKTVMELREIAEGLPPEQVQGFTQMNKAHLLTAICRALHVDMFVHHRAVGIEKTEIKKRIRQLKQQRDDAIAAHDAAQMKSIRHQVHALKRQLHRATV